MANSPFEEDLFTEFCKHLSAGINVVDLLLKWRQLKPGYPIDKDDTFQLLTPTPELFETLKTFQYDQLLQSCTRGLRIDPSCKDVFLSEVEQDVFEIFVKAFERYAPMATVEIGTNGFVVHSPVLISDILFPVISRLHLQFLQTLIQFLAMLNALDNDPSRLFQNSKTPTPESQFVDIWVSHKLNIPMRPAGNLVGVI